MTTFLSYGQVAYQRQGEIMKNLANIQQPLQSEANQIAEAVLIKLRAYGVDMQVAMTSKN